MAPHCVRCPPRGRVVSILGRTGDTDMVERRPALTVLTHLVLILGVLIVAFPVYVTVVASTHTAQAIVQAPMPLVPGDQMLQNYMAVLFGTDAGAGSAAPVGRMMFVSLVSALTIALGKITISLLSAFAIVYFRFPFRNFFFWAIFVTLMLPVEVRIGPTYEVVSDLGMLNSYAGLTVPLIASATAMLAMLPPAFVVLLMQKWFVKGLVETEK